MTYPEKLEKIVAKKYAFPALLFSAALIVAIIEIFAVSFGIYKSFISASRIVLMIICLCFLILFAIMHKNVNFYDVTATAILLFAVIADFYMFRTNDMLVSVPDKLLHEIDIFPGGLVRYRCVLISSDPSYAKFLDYQYSFTFLGLMEGLFLIYFAVCSVIESRHPERSATIDKVNRRVFITVLVVAAIAAITLLLLNHLYFAPLRAEKYLPMVPPEY